MQDRKTGKHVFLTTFGAMSGRFVFSMPNRTFNSIYQSFWKWLAMLALASSLWALNWQTRTTVCRRTWVSGSLLRGPVVLATRRSVGGTAEMSSRCCAHTTKGHVCPLLERVTTSRVGHPQCHTTHPSSTEICFRRWKVRHPAWPCSFRRAQRKVKLYSWWRSPCSFGRVKSKRKRLARRWKNFLML